LKRETDPHSHNKTAQKIGPFSRRTFLRLSGGIAGAGVVYLTLGLPPQRAAALPPGAQGEDAFFATCIRCGLCAQVCTQKAIEFDHLGYPQISGHQGWCDFSGDCARICPSGALQPFDPQTEIIATAVINTDRCIAWNIRGGCQLCFQRCQTLQQAIRIDADRQPHVDAELCNGCGACVHDCPQSAVAGLSRRWGKAVTLQMGHAA
jgi:ferredoxin-type protein NapG